ncbi:MAG: DUF3047 domain-containing protein, partial [Planctomycetes bacterium]|nr:DUF3047 domain-containing protein [Planctomycetota bacterium]
GWEGTGPAAAGFRRRVRDYTGFDPPSRAICYTFGGKLPATEAVDAAFGEGRIVVVNLRSHLTPAGQWQWQVRDLEADYRALFGGPVPPVAAIAAGSDSHRLKRAAWAEFDDLAVYPPDAAAAFAAELSAPPRRGAPPLTWWLIGAALAVGGAAASWWLWSRGRAIPKSAGCTDLHLAQNEDARQNRPAATGECDGNNTGEKAL